MLRVYFKDMRRISNLVVNTSYICFMVGYDKLDNLVLDDSIEFLRGKINNLKYRDSLQDIN